LQVIERSAYGSSF